MTIPESTHLIRFPDCDPFNHLNNARYIDYFINAREDHEMNVFGFDPYRYAHETGKSWVVSQNQVAYFSPALLMEKVVIQSVILEWNTSDILLEMRMWNGEKTRLKALLWSRFVHYDLKQQKRSDHSIDLIQLFRENILSLEPGIDFEKRGTALRKKKADEI